MAPRIKHPEGTFDMHFKVPLDKYKAFMAILHDEGKTQTEDLSEYVNHRVEQKRIEQNPVLKANPLNLSYGNGENGNGNGNRNSKQQPQQPQQSLLVWLDIVAQVRDHKELNKLKVQATAIVKATDSRSMQLVSQGIRC